MSFENSHVQELRNEEARLLQKIGAKARTIMQTDPRIPYASAFAKAIEQSPGTYRAYESCRQQLIAQGVCPAIPSGLGLSRG